MIDGTVHCVPARARIESVGEGMLSRRIGQEAP